MICKLSVMISLIFIVGYIVHAFTVDKYGITQRFRNSLDETQKKIYDKIVKERKWLSVNGYLVGLGVSLVLLVLNYMNKKVKGIASVVSIAAATTFVIQYFFYILSPKSDWMVLHLNEEKQRSEWIKVYREMQLGFHGGIFIGIIGVAILAHAFKC